MSDKTAREIALQALLRIESGERSGPVLASMLADSELDRRDRAFVTNLVQGITRMQRACDHLIDQHLKRAADAEVRQVLRMGAYQLVWLKTPPHAAVDATVGVAPPKARGFVNAILRRIAEAGPPKRWPSSAVGLSYPDWIVELFNDDLGPDAMVALAAMNSPEIPEPRPDGFVQGLASRWVVDEVGADAPMLVADMCAAPGGKSTGIARTGATVVALEIADHRIGVLSDVLTEYGLGRSFPVRADSAVPPLRSESFDRVLVDAPCSGLGAMGRRSDSRWRIKRRDVVRLTRVQGRLLSAAAELVKPGGELIYAVCTVTQAETSGVIDQFDEPSFEPADLVNPEPWRPLGSKGNAGIVLPHDHGTDGMAVARWRRRV